MYKCSAVRLAVMNAFPDAVVQRCMAVIASRPPTDELRLTAERMLANGPRQGGRAKEAAAPAAAAGAQGGPAGAGGGVRAVSLSKDHSPSDAKESKRIVAAGVFVENGRVGGCLTDGSGSTPLRVLTEGSIRGAHRRTSRSTQS